MSKFHKTSFYSQPELTPPSTSPRVVLRGVGKIQIPHAFWFFFATEKEQLPLFRMENRKTQMVLSRKVGSHIFLVFLVFGNSCCPRQSKVENMAAFAVACCTKGCSSLHPSCSSRHQCTDCMDE